MMLNTFRGKSVAWFFSSCIIMGAIPMGEAGATSFAVESNGAANHGNAYAGGAAYVDDASTAYFNPAGLMNLSRTQYILGLHVIKVTTHFSSNNSTINPALGGGGISGPNDDGVTPAVAVPVFFYANSINKDMAFGLSVTSPYGLANEYSTAWVGRYHATESALKTINVNPSLGYRFSSNLSLGVGMSVEYAKMTMANQLDGASVCLSALSGGACAAIDPQLAIPANVAADSRVMLTGDDWAVGWNVGLLYELPAGHRLGFSYRSAIRHDVNGSVSYVHSAPFEAFLQAVGSSLFQPTSIGGSIDMPESASLSYSHQLSNQWRVLADVNWTGWGRYDQLVIKFADATPDSTLAFQWQNTRRYSFAVNHMPRSGLTYRMGIAIYDTPTTDSWREPRIPDQTHKGVAFGVGYEFSQDIYIDIAYSLAFYDDTPINKTDPVFGHTLNGQFSGGRFHNLSAQLRRSY